MRAERLFHRIKNVCVVLRHIPWTRLCSCFGSFPLNFQLSFIALPHASESITRECWHRLFTKHEIARRTKRPEQRPTPYRPITSIMELSRQLDVIWTGHVTKQPLG